MCIIFIFYETHFEISGGRGLVHRLTTITDGVSGYKLLLTHYMSKMEAEKFIITSDQDPNHIFDEERQVSDYNVQYLGNELVVLDVRRTKQAP